MVEFDNSFDWRAPLQIEEFPSFDCYETDAGLESADYATIMPKQRSATRRCRHRYIYYSYCYDALRYPVPLPECVIIPSEKVRFRDWKIEIRWQSSRWQSTPLKTVRPSSSFYFRI
ncbi:XYLOGLUCAN ENDOTRANSGLUCOSYLASE/HYDROLASE PROTEIN 8-RELATED [Salix viminalis]|uniref:XYLOGLUCAN ENDOTRANSGLUCOSYLASE/HYDROLASE PROTEIN 8-RELATED n=1 Tax=Salix viminalis TaxID=40686 RepID=A0A9Q0UTG6_SALVM|nr:XYLOGLUCAN ENDOTRANSGLUCOSYLASE/HYDROLASE PROTEIN 8-RELATED [Salix viminalis]